MKLEIYNDVPDKDEPVCLLQLTQERETATVWAVDRDGRKTDHLLRFHPDGTITRSPHVSKSLGFQLDSEGRIKQNG